MPPSPFPGMDPYLERHWRDVHATLIVHSRAQLQVALPCGLRARIEERVFVETEDDCRSMFPDVRVVESPGGRAHPAGAVSESAGSSPRPLLVHLRSEPASETFIEVVDTTTGHRLVTVLEFLSPTNKRPGDGQDLYFRKQRELLAARVNLVEIDLVRAGASVLVVPRNRLPASHRNLPYQACVWRGSRPDVAEVHAWSLRDPLAAIPIPLRPDDPEVSLDLQGLVGRAYEDGGFDDIDYGAPPDPPLSPADESWADGLLRAAGRRT